MQHPREYVPGFVSFINSKKKNQKIGSFMISYLDTLIYFFYKNVPKIYG